MYIWGITKKYKGLSWWENFMSGHINIGGKITIFGANAMNWVVNIRTKKYGAICFTLPALVRFGKRGYWYLYFSPNGTPWASTFYIGSGRGAKKERQKAKLRKAAFGHNFDTWNDKKIRQQLSIINNSL